MRNHKQTQENTSNTNQTHTQTNIRTLTQNTTHHKHVQRCGVLKQTTTNKRVQEHHIANKQEQITSITANTTETPRQHRQHINNIPAKHTHAKHCDDLRANLIKQAQTRANTIITQTAINNETELKQQTQTTTSIPQDNTNTTT